MNSRFHPTDAFVDESIRGRRYVMGCVLAEAQHLPTLRKSAEGLTSGVAPRIHFNNDTDHQKLRVLDAIDRDAASGVRGGVREVPVHENARPS